MYLFTINTPMRDHFIDVNVEYNKDAFVAMYSDTSLTTYGSFASVSSDLTGYEDVAELFDKFCLPLNNNNCSLSKIIKPVAIHTNPGNNGLIVFPLTGELEVKFYSASPPIVNGLPMLTPHLKDRPHMSLDEINTINNSKIATKIITKPIAINGRKIYSYRPIGNSFPLVFLLKIPFGVEWAQLQTIIENLYA